jgi:hypothetical protein
MDRQLRNEAARWLFGFFSALLGVAALPTLARFLSRKVLGRLIAEIVGIVLMGVVSGRISRLAGRTRKI